MALLTVSDIKVLAQSDGDQWDISLPPEAKKPHRKKSLSRSGVADFTNWGLQLLLPEDVRGRIRSECKYSVVVKIADTGGKYSHNFLQVGQLAGSNYTTAPGFDDMVGHSTHVAGIIAGTQIGLASDLVEMGLLKFKPVKVLNDSGDGMFSWVAKMVESELSEDTQILASGTGVIYNFSLSGGVTPVPVVEVAFEKLAKQGGVIICAAGNSGESGIQYPASSVHGIACGSLTKSLGKSSFSTTGPKLDNAMPGSGINSTYLRNSFAELSGTSMATPFLTAVAAIAQSKWGKVLHNANTMRNYLAWCATDLPPAGRDEKTGWGVVYVSSVLDNNPADMPVEFGGTPDEQTTQQYKILITGPLSGYWIRDVKKDNTKHPVSLYNLELEIETNKDIDAVYNEINNTLSAMFKNGYTLAGGRSANFGTIVKDLPVNIEVSLKEKTGISAVITKMYAQNINKTTLIFEK